MTTNLSVSVKMFRVGELGDCFLLHFVEGDKKSHVLIDCGSFRNNDKSKKRLQQIVAEIRVQLKGKKLDVVVGTHQHNDHLSGFVHCEEMFNGIIDQVWLSWLDDPKDASARRVQHDQKNLVQQLKKIHEKMTTLGITGQHQSITDVLGFFGVTGDDPVVPAKGVEILKKIGEQPVAYLSPGEILNLPGLSADVVKVYVLGPPRNQKMLFDKDPRKGEAYDFALALAETGSGRLLSALENHLSQKVPDKEYQFPFNSTLKKKKKEVDESIRKIYNRPAEAWRKIDAAWLESADRLALYLDSYTNNSSLVLAFELVRTGKVLLFAADAQTGNWNSWEFIKWEGIKKNFTTNTLLENTVLYKVGHHGSHNATLVKALEAMQHPELVAMIPVDKSDPNITKANGWKMPAKNLYKRLKEKTGYRVLRMDDGFADSCDPKKNKAKTLWDQLPYKPKIPHSGLYIEHTIQG